MVCMGFQRGVAGWKVQTNPLSYGGTLDYRMFIRLSTGQTVTVLLWNRQQEMMIEAILVQKQNFFQTCFFRRAAWNCWNENKN